MATDWPGTRADTIEGRAAEWVARADGGLSPRERGELDTWLAADPRHSGAYARALGYWVRLDRVAALSGPAAGSAGAAQKSAAFDRRQLIAAGIATVAIGGASWWLWPRASTRSNAPQASYSSGVGEIKRLVLDDGSVLLLNTSSTVAVELGKQQRLVHLVSGEVLFEVAPNKKRPFVVDVRTAAVRAVGTAFAVRLDSDRVDVTVTEGIVEVAHAQAADSDQAIASGYGPPVARVSAMQQAILTGADGLQVRSIDLADAERQLAWRQGMVSFTGQSLRVAVSEINRYNRRKIIVSDLVLAEKPVVGVFSVTDLDGFVAAAAAALKARVVEQGDIIRLESAPSARN